MYAKNIAEVSVYRLYFRHRDSLIHLWENYRTLPIKRPLKQATTAPGGGGAFIRKKFLKNGFLKGRNQKSTSYYYKSAREKEQERKSEKGSDQSWAYSFSTLQQEKNNKRPVH